MNFEPYENQSFKLELKFPHVKCIQAFLHTARNAQQFVLRSWVPLLTLRTVRLIGAKTLKNHHGQKVALDQPKPHAFSLFRNAAQHEIQRSLPSRKSHSRLVCLDWI